MNKFYLVIGILWGVASLIWLGGAGVLASIGYSNLSVATMGVGLLHIGCGAVYIWLARKEGTNEDQGHEQAGAQN